ncbi:RNA polymerase sigma factor [Candidatus Poriferisocius sp.]|uniref:RNA polymerase sigma factor n=1 Tax=Candidatus Poriferisocius sp. TaxID=3101276 RepID=UPI003B017031
MEAARRGDRDAFNELVRSTYRDLYALAYRLTGNREDAGDVVQEAYVRAYRAIRRFRGDSSFSTWMYRITSNCASTCLSRRSRHRTEELTNDAPIVDLRPEQDPTLRAEAAVLRHHLDRAIRALPECLRQVVVLRDLHDLSHNEIAEELGITTTAAKVRLHRARQRLRAILHRTNEHRTTEHRTNEHRTTEHRTNESGNNRVVLASRDGCGKAAS